MRQTSNESYVNRFNLLDLLIDRSKNTGLIFDDLLFYTKKHELT